ncbi:tandem-95 repeat protein [Candidatus Sumerlaeota bacterium]|nr:tandem-95 repeat protein [Candidatus Sumerlaeota bacterium]
MTYSASQPTSGTDSVANWIGAEFDADNIGGSGVNADGGDDNGLANDEYTYVANNQPVQGQTFVTGANADGYNIDSFTVRMTGYTNNIATGSNMTSWNFNQSNGPMIVSVYEVEDEAATTSALKTVIKQCFFAGEAGNPGATGTANGAGMYITFTPPYAIHLEPDTTYGFDFYIGNGCYNYFEWLGTSDDPFSSGTAYQRSGTTLTKLDGDRVFMVSMTAGAGKTFAHPGTLHTQIDLDRMKAKIAAAEEPWLTGCNTLLSSPYNNLGWPAYDVDYIIRGATGNNYTRCQQDAQLIYTQALIWHLTGDTAYADRAVEIANVWSDLIGVQGDTNASLAYGICGYLFAISGELLSTYPGWVEEDKQAYKDMMMRVFYPGCFDFLWRHHNTFITESGNTHYRLNWDTANMAAIAAIGVLCDNQAVYEQAVDFFKYGAGNGQIQRAAWYIHPDGTAQTEEIGRDQGHNVGGWYAMAVLCQTAWNQGDDLWGYDGNRVLRAIEHTNKYNLWLDVPWVYHRNTLLTYTETLSEAGRGALGLFNEMAYNHYVNIEGMAAPYTQLCAEAIRPEPWPNTSYHPSQVDWFGNGTLTFSRDEIATPSAPSGLHANWSADQIIVNWMGTARAGSYNVKRATVSGGPYTTIGTASALDLNYTDTDVANGAAYYYVVSAIVDSVESAGSAELEVSQQLMTHYTFDSTAEDAVGDNDAELKGGSTGAPSYVTGHDGQALDFDGTDDYAQLPAGIGNYQDITVAAWVYWDGGSAWQRVFDFGTEQEKWMFLTPSNGSVIRFSITTAKGADGTGTLNGPAMSTGVWTHIAVTLNGDTGTLYVNGAPVDAETIDEVDPLFGQPYCYLGKSMYNADPLFNGRIDDFRIYNYALSGADVWDLWGESADNPPAFASDPIYKVNATEDANYSSLSQSLSGDASDPDTGDTLTFSKVTGPDWLSVASGGALSGTPDNDDVGTNTFVVRVTDDSGATDDATLYIYVANVNDAPAWSADPISKVDGTWGVPYSDTLNGDASDVDAGDTLSYSKVDGPDWLSVGTDGTLSGTPGEGDVGANSFTVRVMDGSFAYDDATLEITVIGHTLQAYYEFEDDTTDSIGTNDGTAIGSPVYATGKIGQAIELDASDDYVTLPAGVASYWDITVAAWVYWNGGGDWQRIFDFGNNTNEYMLLTPSSGGNTLRFAITTGSYGSEQLMETSQLATGQWVHVVVTLEGDTGTLYVNGSPAASNSSMTINPEDFDPAVNYIGRSQYSDPLFNGMIDEFRIYNYALSATEVADLYAYEPVNNPPVFTSDPIAKADATEDADYALMSQTLAGSASDDDGDELTFSKVSGPDWLSVASSGALSGAPANDDVGVNDFVVQVSDGRGGTDDATLSIEVVNVNDAPEWDSDPLAKPNARAGAAYSGETLSGDASDIDAGDVLSFAKVSGPDWLIVAVDGALTGTPSSGDAGANAFTVEVSDGNDGSDEAALNIVVLPIILEELSTAVSSRWQIY